tara:strand:- start:86 stop:613 length:528 start_codon:yes stop_codon:yes gene_type:complete
MSNFIDLSARLLLEAHMRTIGVPVVANLEGRSTLHAVTLSAPISAGLPLIEECSLVEGETNLQGRPTQHTWFDTFIVKEPSDIITPSPDGISRKGIQYVVFIRTNKEYGAIFNEAVSGAVELHFPNNLHLIDVDNNNVTVLNTYQQPTIITEQSTGRLFNRVIISCEIYYKNNNN